MFSLRLLSRITFSRQSASCQFHKSSPTLQCKSKREDPPDKDAKDTPKPKKNEEAIKKLNLLLKSMAGDQHIVPSSGIGAQLARPPIKSKKVVKKEISLTTAVKEVAEVLGGDVKRTESELLNKLLSPLEAADDKKDSQEPRMNLSDLISGMKIDKSNDRSKRGADMSAEGRADRVRRILEGRKAVIPKEHALSLREVDKEQQRPKTHSSKIDIFGAEPLGIFKVPESQVDTTSNAPIELATWNRLEARELRLAVTHPPSNIFEEMIQWTEQGKLWKFPINNEQGQLEESKVYFTEHVFLEHHLEPWCPKRGPLRHFMELVCVGLSKNPYITVQMKLEHINWFRTYFEKKEQILRETGAIPAPSDKQATISENTLS